MASLYLQCLNRELHRFLIVHGNDVGKSFSLRQISITKMDLRDCEYKSNQYISMQFWTCLLGPTPHGRPMTRRQSVQ